MTCSSVNRDFFIAPPSALPGLGEATLPLLFSGVEKAGRCHETNSKQRGGFAMKKSKFSEEQIAFALRQAEGGTSVGETCRKMGISEATFYNWKKKYGGLGVAELRRLRQLEEENRKLKQLVADLSLDKVMLQDVIQKKL
jgi:putative transposase